MRFFINLYIILTICSSTRTYCQNLAPNGDFEIYVGCPGGAYELDHAIPWDSLPQWNMPADYFNECGTNGLAVPQNVVGFQYAHSGRGYAGIYTFSDSGPNFRKYMEVKLTDTLQPGKKYCVKFYVSLSDSFKYATNEIGAYFSDTAIVWQNINDFLNFIPQIRNNHSNSLADKVGWTAVSDSFIAQGGETYMTIGNFIADSLSDTLYVGGANTTSSDWNGSYYYIDDVSVYLCDSLNIGINEKDMEKERVSVFPNPTNNILNIRLTSFTPNEEVLITDVLSNVIYQQKLININTSIDVSNISKGIYFYQIKTEKETMQGKFIIER